ncbi:Low molecular weight phosphotyrosine protein phosphatase [Rhizina undulata]
MASADSSKDTPAAAAGTEDDGKISVLMVCLGNICRSPMAEGAFRDTVHKLGYGARFKRIDSCGTAGYHTGEEPDARTLQVLRKNGILIDHLARQVCLKDFNEFDYIIAMDDSNLRDLIRVKPGTCKAKVKLFGHFSEKYGEQVQDPYYGGQAGFEKNFNQIVRFTKGFLREVFQADVE